MYANKKRVNLDSTVGLFQTYQLTGMNFNVLCLQNKLNVVQIFLLIMSA